MWIFDGCAMKYPQNRSHGLKSDLTGFKINASLLSRFVTRPAKEKNFFL